MKLWVCNDVQNVYEGEAKVAVVADTLEHAVELLLDADDDPSNDDIGFHVWGEPFFVGKEHYAEHRAKRREKLRASLLNAAWKEVGLTDPRIVLWAHIPDPHYCE